MTKHSPVDGERPETFDLQEDVLAQISELESRLERLTRSLRYPVAPYSFSEDSVVTAARIRRWLHARRMRQNFFGNDLFADPAWDILLESYASQLLQQRTSVTDLCAAAAVPATTALRWVKKLEEVGLLERHQDPLDARRWWVELVPAASAAMRRYLDTVSPPLPL